SYLKAIEADDIESLPGLFFYKSFVRQYAALLGVNTKELQGKLETLAAPQMVEVQPPAVAPIPRAFRWPRFRNHPVVGSTLGLALALIGTSGVYAWWTKAPKVAPVPVTISTPSMVQPVSAAPAAQPPSVAVAETTDPDGTKRVALNLSATEKTWLSITSGG